MSLNRAPQRRTRVERGVYRQPNGKYAVCFMLDGKPRFQTVDGSQGGRDRCDGRRRSAAGRSPCARARRRPTVGWRRAGARPGLVGSILIDRFLAGVLLGRAARVELLQRGLELEERAGPAAYQRKRTEHKTPAEALRRLNRQLAKLVYRPLRSDHVCQPSLSRP
jgi:hypothetical protein